MSALSEAIAAALVRKATTTDDTTERRTERYRVAGLCGRCAGFAALTHDVGPSHVPPPCPVCRERMALSGLMPLGPLAQGWYQLRSRRGVGVDPLLFMAVDGTEAIVVGAATECAQ